MKMKFYIDLDARKGPESFDPAEQDFLMSRLVKGVHKAIVQECGEAANSQDRLAISFPLSGDASHGGVLRVFSAEQAVLERLLRHPDVHRYARELHASVGAVPATDRLVMFSRDRRQDRLSPSALRRAERRSKEMGFALPSSTKQQAGFTIPVQSESNRQQFLLHIRSDKVANPAADKFNAYGLSTGAGVPLF